MGDEEVSRAKKFKLSDLMKKSQYLLKDSTKRNGNAIAKDSATMKNSTQSTTNRISSMKSQQTFKLRPLKVIVVDIFRDPEMLRRMTDD